MSQKANTVTIGLFIVTALALGVISLMLFSSSKLFTKTRKVIVYFDESLNGLNEGAPVKYRGVTIGSVKQVMVRLNQATNDYAMPVLIQLNEKLIREHLADDLEVFTERSLAERIKLGLRASLQTESLVTGVLYIDIRPNPNASPPFFHQLEKTYPEIPTEPTQIQQLFNQLAALDIKGIEKNLNALLTKLDTTIGSLQMGLISQGITNLLGSVERLVDSPAITNGLAGIRPTLDQYHVLGEKLTIRVDALADSVTNSLAQVDRTLAQFRAAAESLKSMLAPEAPLRNNLDQTLAQLAGAAQSLSEFVEFLKQHPNALITGRENTRK